MSVATIIEWQHDVLWQGAKWHGLVGEHQGDNKLGAEVQYIGDVGAWP